MESFNPYPSSSKSVGSHRHRRRGRTSKQLFHHSSSSTHTTSGTNGTNGSKRMASTPKIDDLSLQISSMLKRERRHTNATGGSSSVGAASATASATTAATTANVLHHHYNTNWGSSLSGSKSANNSMYDTSDCGSSTNSSSDEEDEDHHDEVVVGRKSGSRFRPDFGYKSKGKEILITNLIQMNKKRLDKGDHDSNYNLRSSSHLKSSRGGGGIRSGGGGWNEPSDFSSTSAKSKLAKTIRRKLKRDKEPPTHHHHNQHGHHPSYPSSSSCWEQPNQENDDASVAVSIVSTYTTTDILGDLDHEEDTLSVRSRTKQLFRSQSAGRVRSQSHRIGRNGGRSRTRRDSSNAAAAGTGGGERVVHGPSSPANRRQSRSRSTGSRRHRSKSRSSTRRSLSTNSISSQQQQQQQQQQQHQQQSHPPPQSSQTRVSSRKVRLKDGTTSGMDGLLLPPAIELNPESQQLYNSFLKNLSKRNNSNKALVRSTSQSVNTTSNNAWALDRPAAQDEPKFLDLFANQPKKQLDRGSSAPANFFSNAAFEESHHNTTTNGGGGGAKVIPKLKAPTSKVRRNEQSGESPSSSSSLLQNHDNHSPSCMNKFYKKNTSLGGMDGLAQDLFAKSCTRSEDDGFSSGMVESFPRTEVTATLEGNGRPKEYSSTSIHLSEQQAQQRQQVVVQPTTSRKYDFRFEDDTPPTSQIPKTLRRNKKKLPEQLTENSFTEKWSSESQRGAGGGISTKATTSTGYRRTTSIKTSTASFVPRKSSTSSQISQLSMGSATLSSISTSSPSHQADWNAFGDTREVNSIKSKRSDHAGGREDQFSTWEDDAFDLDSYDQRKEGAEMEGSGSNQEMSLDSSLFTFQHARRAEDINKSLDSSVFLDMSMNNSNDLGNGNIVNDSGFGFVWKDVDSKKENNVSTWAEEEFTDPYHTRGGPVHRFTFNDEDDTFEPLNQCDSRDQMTSSSSIGNSTVSFHSHTSSKQQSSSLTQSKANFATRTPLTSPATRGGSSEYRRTPPTRQNILRDSPKQSQSVMGNSVFSTRTEDSPTGVTDFHRSEERGQRKKIILSEQENGLENRDVCVTNDQWFDV